MELTGQAGFNQELPLAMSSSDRPVVSVVIPCFNQGRFLAEAIDSVLGQTHRAEVIVVDDGSTDNTSTVVKAYPGVSLIQQSNQGAAVARTSGLRQTRGDLVVFLDADDRLLPEAIATGIESLSAHRDWAFVTGHARVIDVDGSVIDTPPQNHGSGSSYIELLRANHIWAPGVVMYRRPVLQTVGAFSTWAGGSADYELNIRIARSFAFGCHHQVVLEYRRHGANMSTDVGYMLQSAVTVRRSERRYVRGNPTAEQAWREGMAIVRSDFGHRLVHQVRSDFGTPGRRQRALRGLLDLLRYYPAGLVRVARAAAQRAARL
jgi:glycosyltransferase involved in cell wall biosynthesis